MASDSNRGDLAEAAQSMRILRAPAKLRHFQRAAQIHIQAAFFGFAVERGRAMDHGLGCPDQSRIVGGLQAETRVCQIPAKYGNTRFQCVTETREFHVQLQRVPEALVRLLVGLRAHQ